MFCVSVISSNLSQVLSNERGGDPWVIRVNCPPGRHYWGASHNKLNQYKLEKDHVAFYRRFKKVKLFKWEVHSRCRDLYVKAKGEYICNKNWYVLTWNSWPQIFSATKLLRVMKYRLVTEGRTDRQQSLSKCAPFYPLGK